MAQKGGKVAKAARLQLENTTGKKVVSKLNARHLDYPKLENKKEGE